MKKIILAILALGSIVSILAQQDYKFKIEPDSRTIYEKPAVGIEPLKSPPITNSGTEQPIVIPSGDRNTDIVTVIDLGTSANAWSYNSNNVGNQKSLVWAEPELNIVTNIHRGGGTLDPGGFSGDYAYDISFDGGMTWTNQVECYVAVDNNGGSDGDAARYPNHGIYNPSGNVEDAYVVFFGPNLDGTNSDTPDGWGGYSYGVANISDPSDTTGNYNRKSSHDDLYQYIPDAFDVTSQGMAIVVDNNVNWTSGTGVYQGSINVNQGYWDDDETDIVYQESLFEFDTPSEYGSPWFSSVAFAPDGMTGYIAILGNDGDTWTTEDMRHSIYPIFWKTIDGGETWDGPNAIQIDGVDGIGGVVYGLLTDEQIEGLYEAPVPPREEIPYTYTGDFEIAVDMNGNLHIAGVVCAAGEADSETSISFFIANQFGGVLDIFTSDGGTTWYAEEMGRTFQYSGTWGDHTEGNRTQITLSPDADKVFISWLDNELEDEEDNNRPNIWCRGFDPSTYMKTADVNSTSEDDAPTNVTLFSAGMWQAFYGTAAKTALELEDGVYTIPYTFVQMTDLDPDLPAQYKYIQDFEFSDADFLITGTEDDIEAKENNISVSQNYPNPFKEDTHITVNLNKGAFLGLEVYTITGQLASSQDFGYTPKGTRNLTFNGSEFPSGVYFFTVIAGENKITRKMIIK